MTAVRALGVIHARGGSVRIPGKNVKPLLGIPLLAWCIAAARQSALTRLIVSTDDDIIASVGLEAGAEVPFRRPAAISEDVASELVTLHALDWAEQDEGHAYDVAVTMQPTTPFIQAADIDAAISAVKDGDADSCFTVMKVSQPPHWMFKVDDTGLAQTIISGGISGDRGVSQSLPTYYIPNGGVYATRARALRERNRLICDRTRVHVMPDARSIDIDEPVDWVVAEAIARHYGFQLGQS